jgi:hypothetical protein
MINNNPKTSLTTFYNSAISILAAAAPAVRGKIRAFRHKTAQYPSQIG